MAERRSDEVHVARVVGVVERVEVDTPADQLVATVLDRVAALPGIADRRERDGVRHLAPQLPAACADAALIGNDHLPIGERVLRQRCSDRPAAHLIRIQPDRRDPEASRILDQRRDLHGRVGRGAGHHHIEGDDVTAAETAATAIVGDR